MQPALLMLILATLGCGGEGDFHEQLGEQTQPLKLSATATASSQVKPSLPASAAVDGLAGTRWASTFADPQWIRLDLGSEEDDQPRRLALGGGLQLELRR